MLKKIALNININDKTSFFSENRSPEKAILKSKFSIKKKKLKKKITENFIYIAHFINALKII